MEETIKSVKKIISESLGVEMEKIENNSNFKEDFGASDLEIFDLLTRLENEYKILLTSHQGEIKTVGDLLTIIRDKNDEFEDGI